MLLYNANKSFMYNALEKVQYFDTGITIQHPIILDVVGDVVRVLDGEADIVYSFNTFGTYIGEGGYTEGGAWEIVDPPQLADDYHLGVFQGEDLYLHRTEDTSVVEHVVESDTVVYSSAIPSGVRIAGVAVGVDDMLILTQPSYSSTAENVDTWYVVKADGTTTSGTLPTSVSRGDISFGYYSNNAYTACYRTPNGWMFTKVNGDTLLYDLTTGVASILQGLNGLPYISGDPRVTLNITDGYAYGYHSSKFVKWKVT